MKAYQDILCKIIYEGVEKYPTRNNKPVAGGIKTLMRPNVHFSHNMEEGFPLLTVRAMPWLAIRVELEGFIHGITSKRWYQQNKCKFWDKWANPKKVHSLISGLITKNKINEKDIMKNMDDLGPLGYAWQMRRFNECNSEHDNGWVPQLNPELVDKADQLARVVNTLRYNPDDRRMVVSYVNPLQEDSMALPPCHWGWNVTKSGNKLNLAWIQRSVDTLRGLPANIASYALLLLLLSKEANLEPGNLSALLVDCHLYEDQIDGAKELCNRKPYPLPKVSIPDILSSGNSTSIYGKKHPYSFFKWTHKDVVMQERKSHPPLKDMGEIVV